MDHLVIFSHWLLWSLVFSFFSFPSQPVGCDHELGSKAVFDACGVCKGDNSTCKFYKGLYLNQYKPNGKSCCCGIAVTGGEGAGGGAVHPLLPNKFESCYIWSSLLLAHLTHRRWWLLTLPLGKIDLFVFFFSVKSFIIMYISDGVEQIAFYFSVSICWSGCDVPHMHFRQRMRWNFDD